MKYQSFDSRHLTYRCTHMKQTLLLADDERDIIDLLKYNFEKEGFDILTASNGKEALVQAKKLPDLILLDIMMPEVNGHDVVRILKADPATQSIPIILLTARTSEMDEVIGLELGADDYVTKPISIPKLIARIKSALRKKTEKAKDAMKTDETLTHGKIQINREHHRVTVAGKDVFFPKKEFEVLAYLVRHAGKVVTRESLLSSIWGADVYVVDRTIDVHIRKIREKLGECSGYIDTIKGVGYRMDENESNPTSPHHRRADPLK
jgi:two-component system alkaline phosphatase synthesis response regulator PhoP